MIVLFTDFGLEGPYIGQVKAVLAREAPRVPVIDLFADAPPFNPKTGAYLLAAFAPAFDPGTVFLSVVDPGVGSARTPVIVEAGGQSFVGPANGLFEMVTRRADDPQILEITWRPEELSASFHGRDLFAPVAARIARGDEVEVRALSLDKRPGADWPDDLAEIVYIDRFGNCMTGLRAAAFPAETRLEAGKKTLRRRRTFSDAREGEAFCYENANGLLEIAVNRGCADRDLGLDVGAPVGILS